MDTSESVSSKFIYVFLILMILFFRDISFISECVSVRMSVNDSKLSVYYLAMVVGFWSVSIWVRDLGIVLFGDGEIVQLKFVN